MANSVPSDKLVDLQSNAQTTDAYVNSTALTVTARPTPTDPTGKVIRTLAGITKDAEDTISDTISALGVVFSDPITNWTPNTEISILEAHRYPADTGDIYIPSKSLPFTTGNLFNSDDWILYNTVSQFYDGYSLALLVLPEHKTLTSNQTIVTFSVVETNVASYSISGSMIDSRDLIEGVDYTVVDISNIQLTSSYPDGTIVTAKKIEGSTTTKDIPLSFESASVVPSISIPEGNIIETTDTGARYLIQPQGASQLTGDLITGNSLVARLMEVDSGGYNAKWFGVIGDGLTSDQAAAQQAFDRANEEGGKKIHFNNGSYLIESLSVYGGSGLKGESLEGVVFLKTPDTDGHMIQVEVSDKPFYMENAYIDGQKNLNTDGNYWDNIHCVDTASTGKFSVEAKHVYSERATGRTWYVGTNRNKPHLTYCYGFNSGLDGNTNGDGIRVNSVSDAYIGEGCGFGSCQGRSVLIATSATPVVSECEIWWSNHRANIEFFECKDWMLRGSNIDRARIAALRIQGRKGTGRDTPDGFHENGFAIGNTFKNPKGANGNGSDGDLNFIDVVNSKGPVISSNNFNYDIEAGDVKVDYIISLTNSENITWTGNNSAPEGDPYQCYASGVTNDEGALWAGGTETPAKFRDKVRVVADSPAYEMVAQNLAVTNRFSRWRVEDSGSGNIVLEVGADANYTTKENAIKCKRNGANIFEFLFAGGVNIESFGNVGSLPVVSEREQWTMVIVEDNGSGVPALAINDGTNWRLNSFT